MPRAILLKLDTSGRRTKLLLGFVAGAVAGLGQAPVAFPFATLIAFVAVFQLFRTSPTARRALWLGWAVGAGYFALSLSWIVEPFLVDIPRHGWMAPFALLFSAVGFGMFWALAFGLAHRISRPGWMRALAWVVALSGAELVRSYLWTGFPWALIGHVWVGWGPMQLAAWVGPHGLTLLTLGVAAGLVGARDMAGRLVVLGVFGALYAVAGWQGAQPVPGAADARPVVRLVQPNAAQHLKWDPDMAPRFFARQIDLTAAPGSRPDLIVWPETSVPALLNDAGFAFDRIAEAAAGVPVVLGIQRVAEGRAYNSLVVLDADGVVGQLYDKYHLVPFGEYMPAPWLLRPLGFSAFTAAEGFGFSAGPGPRVLDLGLLGRALPLICYEAIFPNDVRAGAITRPDWLLQVTNDAWFGKVSGPYQHLAQARLRAVETGLPLARAANTGVSAMIDARGRVTASLALGQAGYLDAALPPPLPATLYYRTGDLPWALLFTLLLLSIAVTGRRKSG